MGQVRTLISTCGTGLQGNARRWQAKNGRPQKAISKLTYDDLREYIEATIESDPEVGLAKVAPEASSILRLEQDGRIDREKDLFAFILTDDLAITAFECYLPYLGIGESHITQLREVSGLTADEFRVGAWDEFARTLILMVADEIAKGRDVAINATAGFKAFLAFSMWVGYFFNIPVFYLYETHPTILEMPSFPRLSKEEFNSLLVSFINELRKTKGTAEDFASLIEREPKFNALKPLVRFGRSVDAMATVVLDPKFLSTGN